MNQWHRPNENGHAIVDRARSEDLELFFCPGCSCVAPIIVVGDSCFSGCSFPSCQAEKAQGQWATWELSAAKQALEGSETVPGTLATFAELTGEQFQLDPDEFLIGVQAEGRQLDP